MRDARVNRLLERPPALRFGASDGDPRTWARTVRAAVQRLARPEPETLTTQSVQALDDGRQRYQLRTADGDELTAVLAGVAGDGEHPAVLVCGDAVDPGLAGQLTAAGIVSLTLSDTGPAADGPAHLLTGRSSLAVRVDVALAALAWLAAQPGTQPDQIGLYGHGPGGAVALHAAVLAGEPLPIAVSGHLGSYPVMVARDPELLALPGILRQVDLPDLYAALLPRPLYLQFPTGADTGSDGRLAAEAVRFAYKSADAEDQIEVLERHDPAAVVAFFGRRLVQPRPTGTVPPLRVKFDVAARLEVADRIDQVLASGMLTQGDLVVEFERQAKRWTGFAPVALSSGSAALDVAYHLIGVAGRTVLVPVNTFFATASSAVRAGATVDFVDVELDGFGLDPESLRAALHRHDDVAAVVAVHIAGVVSPSLLAVRDECAARGIPLVEDSAHALGSELNGQLAGTFGRMSAYSLHPAKVATSGEGGLLGLAEPDDFENAQRWRDHGKVSIDRNVHDRLGTNWRLSEIHAAVGLAHVGRLAEMLAERRALAAFYDEHLDAVPGLRRYVAPAGVASNYYKYVVFLDDGVDRAELKARLRRHHGVSLAGEVYDVLLSDQPYFAAAFAGRTFDRASWFTRRHICLPAFPSMTAAQQWQVLRALRAELA
jgi:perosamine synthetase